jgi:glycosyltransferase involved in cell wall biosynthesis
MYKDKKIGVVVPAYNEEKLIGTVIDTMPDFVDIIIVVDDKSKDNTTKVVKNHQGEDRRVVLIRHEQNQGVGGAIVSGYKKAMEMNIDVTAIMAGDAQMDPGDLIRIVEPVANGETDYTKGNRLFRGESWRMIPHYRYFGNSSLSVFTKVASGYWHVADSQSGYTAISKNALRRLDLDSIYRRYGMPNDILIKLNIHNFRVKDVSVRPIYNIGEKSGIRLWRVIPVISLLLIKGFFRRMVEKYIIRDFHPLVLFYLLAFVTLPCSIFFLFRTFYFYFVDGLLPKTSFLLFWFLLISGLQSSFFAMWFDMEANKGLK